MADELGRVQLEVVVNTATLKEQLEGAQTLVTQTLKDPSVTVKLDTKALDNLKSKELKISVADSQVTAAIERLNNLKAKIGEISSLPRVTLGVDITGATPTELQAWRQATNGLVKRITDLKAATQGGGTVKAGVTITGTRDTAKLLAWADAAGRVAKAAKDLQDTDATVSLAVLGVKEAASQVEALQAQLRNLTSGSPYEAVVKVTQVGADPLDLFSQLNRDARASRDRPGSMQRETFDPVDLVRGPQDELVRERIDRRRAEQEAETAKRTVAEEIERRSQRGQPDYLTNADLARIAAEAGNPQPKRANRTQLRAAIEGARTADPIAFEELRRAEGLRDLNLRMGQGGGQNQRSFMDPIARWALMMVGGMSSDAIRDELLKMQPQRPEMPRPPDPFPREPVPPRRIEIGPSSTGRLLPPAPPASPLPQRLSPAERAALQGPALPDPTQAANQAARRQREQQEADRREFTRRQREADFQRAVRPAPVGFDPNRPAAAARERQEQARRDFTAQQRANDQRRASQFAFTPPATRPLGRIEIPDSILRGIAEQLYPRNVEAFLRNLQQSGLANNIPFDLYSRAQSVAQARGVLPPPISPLSPYQQFERARPAVMGPLLTQRAFPRSMRMGQGPSPYDWSVPAGATPLPLGARDATNAEVEELNRQIEERRRNRQQAALANDDQLRQARQDLLDLRRTQRQNRRENFGPLSARDTTAGRSVRETIAEENVRNARLGTQTEARAIEQLAKATVAAAQARTRQAEAINDAVRREKQLQTQADRTFETANRASTRRRLEDRQTLAPLNALFGGLFGDQDRRGINVPTNAEQTARLRERLQSGQIDRAEFARRTQQILDSEAADARRGTRGAPPPRRGVENLVGARFFGRRIGAGDLDNAFSNALVGGAFPALFGQGIGASLGGAAGGGIGGLLGGQLGFGASLLGTGIGAQFDALITKATEAAAALKDPINNLQALADAGVIADRGLAPVVATLQSLGRGAEAAARVRQELGASTSVGVRAAQSTGRFRDELFRGPNAVGTNIGGLLAATGNLFQASIGQGLQDSTFLERLLPGGAFTRQALRAVPFLPGVRDTEAIERGRQEERRALERTRAQQEANAAAVRFRGQGFEGAAADQEARARQIGFRQEIARLQTEIDLTRDNGQKRALQLQLEEQRRLQQVDRDTTRADRQQRRRSVRESERTLAQQERVFNAGFIGGDRSRGALFGQDRQLAEAAANVENRRLERDRLEQRFNTAPAADKAAAELAFNEAVLEANKALREQQDLQRSVRLELEAAQTAGARRSRDAQQGVANARQLLPFIRPEQSGSELAVTTRQEQARLLQLRDDRFADIGIAERNNASPADIENARTAFREASAAYDQSVLESARALKTAAASITETIRGLTRQREDLSTGLAAGRGSEDGLNKFLSPQEVVNRQQRANEQLFAEADRLTAQLGVKPVTFSGTLPERNAQIAEFITAARGEIRAGEDIATTDQKLADSMKSLTAVNERLAGLSETLSANMEGLTGATSDLAAKRWNVVVNVNSGSVGGDARAAQVAI